MLSLRRAVQPHPERTRSDPPRRPERRVQSASGTARAPALCSGTGLAPGGGRGTACGRGTAGASAASSGVPPRTDGRTGQRIRAQNPGQGPFILRPAFSSACKAPETGRKGEEGPPDPSGLQGGAWGAPALPWLAPGTRPHSALPGPALPGPGGQHHPATEPEPPAGWRRAFPKVAEAYEGITGPWDVRLEGNLRPPSPPSWKFMCGKLRPRGRL